MSKPDYTTSIVQVFPGETIPAALLFKLHSENQSAMGLVVRNGNLLDIEKFDEMDSVEDEVKETTLILESTKKHHRELNFHSFPEGFSSDEVQPWIPLKNSKGEPLLCVSIEGDFPGRATDGHSEAYAVMHEYLGPKIEEMYKVFGNDMKKLIPYLQSDGFHKDLDNLLGHRAVFEFLPSEGDSFTYGKTNGKPVNEIGLEGTWGRASNVYGYSESAIAAATPATAEEPGKKRSKYADDGPDTKLPDGVHAVPPKPVATPPKADPEPVRNPIEKAAEQAVDGHWETIPTNLHGKRKKAYIRGLTVTTEHPKGALDPAWDTMTRVWVKHQPKVNSLQDLNKTAAAPSAKAADVKNNVAENLPVPVISGAEQAAVTAFIKKYLDGNSNRVENPLEIQKAESRLPVFTELAGQSEGLDFFDGVRTDVIKNLVDERPQSAWLLLLEYRQDRRKRKMLMAQGDKKLGELVGTEVEDPTPGTTQAPESPAPGTVSPPVEAPKKSSRYA